MEHKGSLGSAAVKRLRGLALGMVWLWWSRPTDTDICEEALAACWSPMHPGPTISGCPNGPGSKAFAQCSTDTLVGRGRASVLTRTRVGWGNNQLD